MKWLYKLLLQGEFIALMILPFLGYAATGVLNKGIGLIPFLGIAPLILFQLLAYAFWKNQTDEPRGFGKFSVLLSFAFITYNFFHSHGNIWLYFTEKYLLEVGAICLGFILFSFFGKNNQERKMGQDVGYGVPILLGAIILGSFIEVFTAWKNHSPFVQEFDFIEMSLLAGSFLFDVLWIYPLLGKMARKEIDIKDLSATKYGMPILLTEIGLWIFGIPILLYFTGCFAS